MELNTNSLVKTLLVLTALASSTTSVIIQCQFEVVSWTVINSRYSCESTTTLTHLPEANITEVGGAHLPGRSNADVEMLNVRNQLSLTRLPKRIDNFFPNLVGLQWIFGGLSTISADDLKPFPNLQILSLYLNKFVTLDGGLLQNSLKLQWINLNDNSVEHVRPNFLDNLRELRTVHLQRNRCVNISASTQEALQALKVHLSTQCSDSAPTTDPSITVSVSSTALPGGCTIRCSIDNEVTELRERVVALESRINKMSV